MISFFKIKFYFIQYNLIKVDNYTLFINYILLLDQ